MHLGHAEGRGERKLRRNPRTSWYGNLEKVTINGDFEATFHLTQPQPSFLVLLASGYSPVYPCHVPPDQMRTKPVGTGPYKLTEFKAKGAREAAAQHGLLEEGPTLSRRHRHHDRAVAVDGHPGASSATVRHDGAVCHVTIPLLKDVKAQAPNGQCEIAGMNNSTNLILNRDAPPFDNPEIRKAMALGIDRKAFIDIINQGRADAGGTMQPAPNGVWGLPKEILDAVPGYGPDVEKNRAEGRAIMKKLGYGPGQAAQAQGLDPQPPALPRARGAADRPAQGGLFRGRARAGRHRDLVHQDRAQGLCDRPQHHRQRRRRSRPDLFRALRLQVGAQLHRLLQSRDREAVPVQSRETDLEKRKKIVWEIDRQLLADGAKPVIMWNASASCWHPYVKGFRPMVNSLYNGSRFEDIWLDK